MAQNHAGFPTTTAFHTINLQCSSGLAAITSIAHAVAVGGIDVGIGAGMESMTRNYGPRTIPTVLWSELKDSPNKDARDCIIPMGLTSENVASCYGITREDQDVFAARSHQKAAQARRSGLFDAEIVPVTTRWIDPEDLENVPEKTVTITQDDSIHLNTTVESLSRLKPAFKADGTSTAGNSSQITDGAAATLLMRHSTASSLGFTSFIIGKWYRTQVIGCAPDEMGIGPAAAIPKLSKYTGLSTSDTQIWEINEAFASQALYSMRKLRIDEAKVNRKGGAIALGHPLGATGARQVATLLPKMGRPGAEVGVVSMNRTGHGEFIY